MVWSSVLSIRFREPGDRRNGLSERDDLLQSNYPFHIIH